MKRSVAAFVMTALLVSGCAAGATPGSPSAVASQSPTIAPSVSEPQSPSPGAALFRETTVPVPRDPGSIAVRDFNGDGKLDIATANSDGSVSLLLGTGTGTFDRADYPGGKGSGAIAVADLNADGRLDIVVAHPGADDRGKGTDDIVVLLAGAAGTFATTERPAGVNPEAVAIADFNGDGKPDLATADNGDHVSIFAGRGDGTFDDPQSYPTGARFSSGISAADFNGDGQLDLATSNSLIGLGRSDRTISVLLGVGEGTFKAPIVLREGGQQPIMPVVADFNGDGALDIVAPNGGGAYDVSILLGAGDGTFLPARKYPTGPFPHSVVVTDLDGDGHLDLAAWDSGVGGGPLGKGLSVLFGKGDGTFEPTIDRPTVAEGGEIGGAGDLDGDGKIDLIVIGSQQLILLFNTIAR